MTTQHFTQTITTSVVCLITLILTSMTVSANPSGCCQYTYKKPNNGGLGTACVTVDKFTCRNRFGGTHKKDKRCERKNGKCYKCNNPRFGSFQEIYAFFNVDTGAIAIGQQLTSETPAVDINMSHVDYYENLYISGCGEIPVKVQDIQAKLSFSDHDDPNMVGFTVEHYTLTLASMAACDRITGPTELSLVPRDQVHGTINIDTGEIWADMTLQLKNDLGHPVIPSLTQHSISGSWDATRRSIEYLSFGGSVIQQPDNFGKIVVTQTDDFTQVMEDGARDTIEVALGSPTELPVIVQLEVNNEGLSVDRVTLTFTRENWSVPQAVQVSASDNGITDLAPRFAVITLMSLSEDPIFAHHKRHIMTKIVDQVKQYCEIRQ